MHTVLLVEDDVQLAWVVRDYLQQNGYRVKVETQGDIAAKRIVAEKPDLVILDINLPKMDGFSLCRQVREDFHGAIIMLTARLEDVDEVLGLELGADDYLSKPVRPAVLLARLGVHLRRNTNTKLQEEMIKVGGLEIFPERRAVELNGQPIHTTSAEFDLLTIFARDPGKALDRADLFKQLNPTETYNFQDRSIDLRVSRLRRKLGDDPNKPTRIVSIRGNGYMLAVIP